MTDWLEYVQRDAHIPEWPYPIRYGEEKEIEADVLVLGGGIAGCHAAINAARKGVRVVIVEKGATKRSGAGGAGVDHWLGACTNPCSKVTPEEYTRAIMESSHGYACGPSRYIDAMESWEALLDCERMGIRIRDVDDEFKGADFRDEKTRLMFAYDYENRHTIRVYGYNVKPCLYREVKRLGVTIFDRVTVTSLLTEGGRQGARVVGATGVNARSGEFYIFKSKATIVATGWVGRLWFFAPELVGPAAMKDLNSSSIGLTIGWNAGAELVNMEQNPLAPHRVGTGYAPYSMGNASNTYHGTPLVDDKGREVGWFNLNGKELKSVKERFHPAKGQRFMLPQGIGLYHYDPEFHLNHPDPGLVEKIRKGEYTLPLYADLSRLPETERRVIFGMMVGNEGKTRIPVYDTYSKAGFDPNKDMLQAPVMNPESYNVPNYWGGRMFSHLRDLVGGYLVDWDLRTNLEGLYAAGLVIFGTGSHASAAVTGRYAGRKAAEYAISSTTPAVSRKQVEVEKERVYSPLQQNNAGNGWKELNNAITRIMQDYCDHYRNESTLKLGIRLLRELAEVEAASAYATNPHELGRLLECFSLITCGEIVMRASLARKCSSLYLDFHRMDYPDLDPPEWQILLPIRLEDGKVKVRELPFDYHLKPPYAPSYEENYKSHYNYQLR